MDRYGKREGPEGVCKASYNRQERTKEEDSVQRQLTIRVIM